MLAQILLSLQTLTAVPITHDVTDLGPHLVWIEDHQGGLSLEQVTGTLGRGDHAPSHEESPNLGFVHHPVYFAVTIKNQTNHDHFVLNIGYPLLDDVTLFVLSDQGISPPFTSGDHQSFVQRFRPYRTINFKVSVPRGEKALLLLRVKTESALQLPLHLHSEARFGDYMASESLGLGLFYGLMIVMILYNAFLYLSLRMTSYLYYTIYMVCLLIFQASLHGVVFQFFLPNVPGLSDKLLWVWGSVGWFFGLLFAYQFHDLGNRLPRLARFVRMIMACHVALLILNFVLPYHIVVRLGAFLTASVDTLTMLGLGFASLRHGYRPARFFVLGWGVLVISNFIYSMKTFGLLPNHVLIEHSMLIGSSIEAILLSLALGDRVHLIQQERDDANQALIKGYSRLQLEIDRREELEHQKDALGREIRVATEQLIQADKMSTMGQLVAGVAHDIANPTQLIIGSQLEVYKTVKAIEERLEALLDSNEPEVLAVKKSFSEAIQMAKVSLDDISTAVNRIEAIQSAIRNQARVDSRPSQVHLRPLLDECMTILRSKLKPLHITVECPDDLVLECRRSQLGQVMTNLISNAADAIMEKGVPTSLGEASQIRIRAGVVGTLAAEGVIFIEVEDDGPGIPDQLAQQIFEPFFTTKEVGVGTGLGLSICQKIVDGHGGSMVLKAPQDLQGACFRIELPARSHQEAA